MLAKVPHSREEITLPWLQEAFKQHPFDILRFHWDGNVGGGIGALSSLERLHLTIVQDGLTRSIPMIVKSPPNSAPGLRDFVISEGFCQREYQMYTKVFPSWRKFQESRKTPEKYRFRHPECYYSAEEGEGSDYNMILLLEDMEAPGYATWSAGYRKGLKLAQAKHVVRELALFHAVGMAYKEAAGIKHYTGPDYSFLYTHSKDQGMLDGFLQTGIKTTCEMLKRDAQVPEALIKDIQAFNDVKKLQEMSFPEERAGTITHQDLHIHNVMFNEGAHWGESPIALLDFQGCSYANPMSDLTFFLLLNCDPSVFTDELAEILEHYHAEFKKAIYHMDSDVKYPAGEIAQDYYANLFVSIIHIILGSPSWCFGPYTSEDTEKRFKLALLDSYEKCGQRLGLECLEYCEYFSSNEQSEE